MVYDSKQQQQSIHQRASDNLKPEYDLDNKYGKGKEDLLLNLFTTKT